MTDWHFSLFLSFVAFVANAFIQLLTMDLEFFETYAPAVVSMYDAITAVGWALLLGNLVFQALKIMMAGFGGEVEDPASLIGRTTVYGFLLLCSRQIFGIGLSLGTNIINLIGLPTIIIVTIPDVVVDAEIEGAWFIVMVLTVIIGIALIKMLFAIGERYVVLCVLILLAPIGFSMGGSKATKSLATGYIRMFASMVLLVVLNIVFLKLILSVMSTVPTQVTVIPWVILIVGLSRVARKADSMVTKIGLNPVIGTEAATGGRGGMLAVTLLAAKMLIKNAAGGSGGGKSGGSSSGGKSSGGSSGGAKSGGSGNKSGGSSGGNPPNPQSNTNTPNNSGNSGGSNNQSNSNNSANSQSSQNSNNAQGGANNQRFGSGANPKTQQGSARNTRFANTVNAGQNAPQNADGSANNANNANNSQQKPNSSNSNNQQNQGGSQMWNVMSEKKSPKSSVNAPVSSSVNSETSVNTPANSQSAPKPQSQGGSQSGGNKPYIVPNSKAANAGNPQSNSRNSGTANPPANAQNNGKNGNAPANVPNNGKNGNTPANVQNNCKKADAPASVQSKGKNSNNSNSNVRSNGNNNNNSNVRSKGKNQPATSASTRFGNQANTKPPTHINSSSNGSPAPIDVRDSDVFDKGKNAPSEAATPETVTGNSVNTNE